jgi:hypothetical protein
LDDNICDEWEECKCYVSIIIVVYSKLDARRLGICVRADRMRGTIVGRIKCSDLDREECKRHYLLFYCCTRIIIQRRCEKAEDMRQRMIGRIVGLSVIILLLYTYNNTANWMRGGRGE